MQFIQKGSVWVGKRLFRLMITMLLVIIISFLPSMVDYVRDPVYRYRVQPVFSPSNYVSSVSNYLVDLSQGNLGTYTIQNVRQNIERKITTDVFRYYKTTLVTFLSAIVSGVFFGLLAGFIAIWLKRKWRSTTQFFSFFLISIPDFFIILGLQWLVIYVYKQTGIKLFAVATAGSSTAVFAPIFTLALFPFAYIFRTTLHSFESVLSERFIQTAYAKGLDKLKVLWRHIFKNGLVAILNNMPSILMLTLSNMVIVEYMFNTHGITDFIFSHSESSVLTVSILLLWLMIEGILLVNQTILLLITRKG